MSVGIVRRSFALGIAALVLGFAGTKIASADPRENWGRSNVRVQSREWRDNDSRRSQHFRSERYAPRYRLESFRRDEFRQDRRPHDSRFGFSLNFGPDCDRCR